MNNIRPGRFRPLRHAVSKDKPVQHGSVWIGCIEEHYLDYRLAIWIAI